MKWINIEIKRISNKTPINYWWSKHPEFFPETHPKLSTLFVINVTFKRFSWKHAKWCDNVWHLIQSNHLFRFWQKITNISVKVLVSFLTSLFLFGNTLIKVLLFPEIIKRKTMGWVYLVICIRLIKPVFSDCRESQVTLALPKLETRYSKDKAIFPVLLVSWKAAPDNRRKTMKE